MFTLLNKQARLLFIMLLLFLSYPVNGFAQLIVIDAGHGGHDSGCIHDSTLEKDITLAVSKKICSMLDNCVLTREKDVYISLQDRVRKASEVKASLFISIHVNSSTTKPSIAGSEIYEYFDWNKFEVKSKLAERLRIGLHSDRGIKAGNHLYVIRKTKMKAILIELGFINVESDRANMLSEDWQSNVAKTIVKAIQQ